MQDMVNQENVKDEKKCRQILNKATITIFNLENKTN